MGEVPPGGTCSPRRGAGARDSGTSLGAPGDWGSCLPSQPHGPLRVGWKKGRRDKARREDLA